MGNSTSKKDNVIHADIADGNEPIPIKVINNYNEKQPFPFQYGTEYRLSEKVKSLTYQPTESDGCNCVAECTSELCRCESSSTATFDTINRRMQTFIDSYTCGDHQYIECGQHCGCMAKCKRRLTRDTIMKNIEVRYKPDVGFTVIACQHIAAGMPIMNYIGNVVIQEELEKNLNAIWGTDYTFNFHNEGNHKFHCDAAEYGNISRFMSHSCDPNAYILKAFPSTPFDKSKIVIPKLVVIALRSIIPGNEITITYGASYFRDRDIPCLCYTFVCAIPPDDFENKRNKTLDDAKRERAQRRQQVEMNMEDTTDICDNENGWFINTVYYNERQV